MSSFANFAATPNVGVGQLTVANANRDGSGTMVVVFTAGANGSRIDSIVASWRVTNTTGTIRYFLKRGGVYYNLPEQAVTPATTVSATVAGLSLTYPIADPGFLLLKSGDTIEACQEKAESCTVVVTGADF